MAKRSC